MQVTGFHGYWDHGARGIELHFENSLRFRGVKS
jgi:hypothetical protein